MGGSFLVPLKKFRDFHLTRYLNRTCALALLAAFGTSGYSIVDDEALRIFRGDSIVTLGNTQLTLLYSCLEALSASIWLVLFVVFRKSGRSNLREVLLLSRKSAVFAGGAIFMTYTLVLISMAHVENVSYVVGFRQLSIPLGATLGIFVLKEKAHRPKLLGVTVIFAGLMLVVLG